MGVEAKYSYPLSSSMIFRCCSTNYVMRQRFSYYAGKEILLGFINVIDLINQPHFLFKKKCPMHGKRGAFP